MAEVILFDASKSTGTERLQILSYLAVKYGITLDQSTATGGVSPENGDYLDSTGAVIFDAHDGLTNNIYDNDITVIGQDTGSDLDQKVSKSINSGSIAILATTQDFTSPNSDAARTSLADGGFLAIGDDGMGTTFTTAFSATHSRMDRVWQVSETGTVGAVFVGMDSPIQVGSPVMIVSSDPVFDASDTVVNLPGGAIPNASYDFTSGDYFTFAGVPLSPGGVNTGLAFWLKADAGATPALWSDQSGLSNDAVQATPADQPVSYTHLTLPTNREV